MELGNFDGNFPIPADMRQLPDRLHRKARSFLSDFHGFLFKQNILSLAIGIIIGTATGNVVSKINADIFMPIVNLFFRNQQWKTMGPIISRYKNENGQWIDNKLLVGDLLFTFSNLLVIGLICYFLSRLLLRPTPVEPAPPMRQCPFCLENVAPSARKCKFCCSELPAAPPAAV